MCWFVFFGDSLRHRALANGISRPWRVTLTAALPVAPSPSGKASDSDSDIRWFKSIRGSHIYVAVDSYRNSHICANAAVTTLKKSIFCADASSALIGRPRYITPGEQCTGFVCYELTEICQTYARQRPDRLVANKV